ncbi:hypothetical protein TSTA_082330 [Talaromyces stipitatus ATCC 10500]|uniref:Uncharacterized protein n=1 Tax=Talaromyces stipitatus (strain ATCC 10500 / CBS 375.48 / QM 6759 / NRRL 1006) TaxID=441959 RepID=B8M158_TALSN|nr:uncharacterized protein TSTA_082330 [Talaromyces stipitatus ATCC 10500]EED21000.1 hypothetical protein TSTA_082330 [Talaromyces stipitatus ATCC 10500]
MASNANPTQDLPPVEYARMFKEAMDLKMIPYDTRCGANAASVKQLMRLHQELLSDLFKLTAEEIGQWCLEDRFASEVRTRMPSKEIPLACVSEKPDHDLWYYQAECCFGEDEFHQGTGQTRRYLYFVFGMNVWRIQPKPEWALRPGHRMVDAWYELGYATCCTDYYVRCLRIAYYPVCSESRGIGSGSFVGIRDLAHIKEKMLEGLQWPQRPPRQHTQVIFYDNLTNFIKNQATGSEESVWRLQHAISLNPRRDWREIARNSLFKQAAWDYRLTTLLDTGLEDSRVNADLQEAYRVAIQYKYDPMILHMACIQGRLEAYVTEANLYHQDMPRQVSEEAITILRIADETNRMMKKYESPTIEGELSTTE